MISLKLIKKEQYDELLKKDTHFLQQITELYDSNALLCAHLDDLKARFDQLQLKADELNQQNRVYLNQIHQIRHMLSQKNAECTNLKSNIEALKAENNETEIKVIELKASKNQIQIRLADFKAQQKCLNSQLANLKQKNEDYERIIKCLQNDISVISEKNIELQINYDLIQQNRRKQIQNSQKQLLQIQKLSYQCQVLQEKISKINEIPQAKLKQKLVASQEWIKQLTKQYNQLKQKFIQKQVQKQKIIPGSSTNGIYQKSQEDFQRAKYIQLCKTLLYQFNSKIQKIQKQKQKIQNKYKIVSLKLNDYQYNEFKYKDKISLYIQKIDGYEKLAAKQQNQLQKIINQFDKELDNIVKLKQSQMQKQILQVDTFQLDILTKEVESLRHDVKKLKKEKKKNNQNIVLLEQDNYNLTIQIRKLKGYNHDLISQLQIKSNQVQILKSRLSSNGSHTNRSQQQLLSTISRLSNKNTNGKISQNQDKYEYQVSEIDTENQRKNEKLMRMCSPRKYFNAKVPSLIKEDPKKLQQSLISQSSSSNSNDSSQCLSSNQGLNDSVVSKGSSKSYMMKQNYSYTSQINPNSKFIMHKNSMK